jgi:natural product precursor
MKKSVGKLSLNKITISNLDQNEMSDKVGGKKALPKTLTHTNIICTTKYSGCW